MFNLHYFFQIKEHAHSMNSSKSFDDDVSDHLYIDFAYMNREKNLSN